MAMKERGSSKGEKALVIGVVLFVGLVGGAVWWWSSINTDPVVKIPEKVLPVPNAHTTFVAATTLTVDTGVTSNGYDAIHRGAMIPAAPTPKPVPSGTPPVGTPVSKSVPSLAEMDAEVKRNAAALATLRAGFADEYVDPGKRSMKTLFPHYAKFRHVARLLVVESYTRSAHGDWGGAMTSTLDAMELGVKVPRGGPLIGMLVGIALEAIGRSQSWKIVEHLSAAETRAALARLEAINAQRWTFAQTLEEEKYYCEASILELFHTPKWRTSSDWLDGAGSTKWDFRMLTCSKREVMAHFISYMDALIARARQPYTKKSPLPPMPDDPINQLIVPVFSKAEVKDTVCRAQDALLLTKLALHAYHLDHGTYPAKLTELTPTYLKTLPDDPFAPAGACQYKHTGATYVLYSVGPNGKDDGGTPSPDGQRKSATPVATPGARTSRPTLTAGSTGDIVAGVNVQ